MDTHSELKSSTAYPETRTTSLDKAGYRRAMPPRGFVQGRSFAMARRGGEQTFALVRLTVLGFWWCMLCS